MAKMCEQPHITKKNWVEEEEEEEDITTQEHTA